MNKKFLMPVLTFTLGAMILFGWYEFIYVETRQEITMMESETRQLKDLEREISKLKARHEDLSAYMADMDSQLDRARMFLPETLSQENFIAELYQTAEICRAQIISVNSGEAVETKSVQSQTVNIRLETDYLSLLNFIRATLDGSRLVSLESFTVESDGGILICDLVFKIFAEVQKTS
ncbi:MAG: type 4a pilus biogenesis protein PilO [Selenomonadaceae bacterium]|nr:type 4a pilus biogenesis protein PilO [Selenomonadaceae bacterium]